MATTRSTFGLDGTRAVVIGASQGIGAGVASALAEAGAQVVLAGRDVSRLQPAASAAAAVGTVLDTLPVDVAQPESIESFAAEVLRRHGTPTIVVNCANVRLIAAALATSVEDWDETFAVHVRGPFLASKAFGPGMIEAGYGKIINFSSHWAARVGVGRSAYGAAKAAVSQMTAALGVEWAPHGVRVNAVAPAATLTQTLAARLAADPDRAAYLRGLIPLGRMAEVDDITPVVTFLAGRGSDFITGQTIFIDGGAAVAG